MVNNMRKIITLFIVILVTNFAFSETLRPGDDFLMKNSKNLYGYLFPESYQLQYFKTKSVCSKIAPATDGYVELVISVIEPAGPYQSQGMKSTDISIFIKPDDRLRLEFFPVSEKEQAIRRAIKQSPTSLVIIRIISASPNFIEYEIITEY